MADVTGNGVADLAVLTADGVSIYLGNGERGFSPPVTYNAGVDPTGLTVTDLLGTGKLDLLVGNVYGDVLILVGNGDGTLSLLMGGSGGLSLTQTVSNAQRSQPDQPELRREYPTACWTSTSARRGSRRP